ncbi:N-acetylglutaminylglutamine amidotransferase [Thiomicrorhabdus sp. ZW0627]|uniref:N-acetylglutaminylglutamine amidotransferase n=1 Tax=Thiomicrorhabdus sp. ZW0627 TaxID=3039774 RepID=UPI002436D8D8|nr:N-acetylglutaminylglutamine amidotransferase [Thiomicrorhabdus sp. ZW0627]MDG6774052.1 N-acetylglutaminylglutamine amidotransferase [Thiomicrorhabdus sp. ZW0627]
MCGICGEIYWDGQLASETRLKPMLAALEKRGPDDGGSWVQDHVGLGHRRLSIIDLTDGGHQPMRDQALSLVFNGCIYNYQQLKAELEEFGHEFTSHSDTEVILKAYRQWGMECVNRFEGMFAFAIWDDDTHQLLLARDRMGIKPLYYSPVEGGVRFASNPQALLTADDVDTSIDPIGLHHQLTLHAVIPAPHTILKGVRKLEPGHWMIVNPDGQIYKKRYWFLEAKRPDPSEKSTPQTQQAWIDAIHESLKEAVHKRLTASDVPVGVLLSGGLDSSLIVGLLHEAGVENIKTFSIGFEDAPEEKGSEFEYSDKVVERFNTDHKQYLISNSDVLPRLHEAVDAMAEPMVGQDAIAFYLLSEQVAQDVKVVMSGQGADEVFGGYFWYAKMAQAAEGIDLKDHHAVLDAFRPYYFDRSHQEWLEVINPEYHVEDVTSDYIGHRLTEPGADTFLDQVLRLDVTTLVVDDPVKRVDNMTMAWGLEARVPFLDHKLVELTMSAPSELKLIDDGKFILKQIARGLLPDEVIDRPKVAFPMPALKYVRGEFFEFMKKILTSPQAKARGIFNELALQRLLDNPEAPESFTAIQGSKLWHAALLEFWLQKHVDKTL